MEPPYHVVLLRADHLVDVTELHFRNPNFVPQGWTEGSYQRIIQITIFTKFKFPFNLCFYFFYFDGFPKKVVVVIEFQEFKT